MTARRRKLPFLTHAEALSALSGRVEFSGQGMEEPKSFAKTKREQGLKTRITPVGGRSIIGEGDTLGSVTVSFWV